MKRKRPSDRWGRIKWASVDTTKIPGRGDAVLLGLSSQKYCDWYNLGDAMDYARSLVTAIRRVTDRPIIYRPKPSWGMKQVRADLGIEGVELSVGRPLAGDLARTWVLVTHGSGVALNAILMGIPAIVLCKEAIASPMCGDKLEDIERPLWRDTERRAQWAHNLAYTQWARHEIETGDAWECIQEDIQVAT